MVVVSGESHKNNLERKFDEVFDEEADFAWNGWMI